MSNDNPKSNRISKITLQSLLDMAQDARQATKHMWPQTIHLTSGFSKKNNHWNNTLTAITHTVKKHWAILEEINSISNWYTIGSSHTQPQIVFLNQIEKVETTNTEFVTEGKDLSNQVELDVIETTSFWSLPIEDRSSLTKEHRDFIISTIEYSLSQWKVSSFIVPITNQTIKEIYVTLPLNNEELGLLNKLGDSHIYYWTSSAEYYWGRAVKGEKHIKFRIDKQHYMIT